MELPTSTPDISPALLHLLRHGALSLEGVLPYSSNYSLLGTVTADAQTAACVYKPREGENPLRDFPYGTLCQREAAAYQISEMLGWHLVPPTFLREGEYGLGSVQLYIPHDPEVHYFNLRFSARHAQTLRHLSLFDYVVNNADRKSGHCLVDPEQRLWAIDHGICFHARYKLRTVIWEFEGEAIPDSMLRALVQGAAALRDDGDPRTRSLSALLSAAEREALLERLERLLTTRLFPSPRTDRRNFPWPPI